MTMESSDSSLPAGTFEIRMEMRWGDMDSMLHVNNTVYFRYFEEARVRLFEALSPGGFRQNPVVLAHASCDFLKPLLYPASIVVGLKLVRVGRSSIEVSCWIADAGRPDEVYARGRNVLVCIDLSTQRPRAWSAEELQGLRRCFSA